MDSQATIFVVDDDLALLKSLRWLLESANLRVETFKSALEFLAAFDPGKAGCLLLDVRMPGMSGIELQKELNVRKAHIPTIFITGHGDVPMAVRCLSEGAFDFIEKPYDDQELLSRIQAALEEDARIRSDNSRVDRAAALIAGLTPRERQVMELIAGGRANKDIAKSLDISEKTVAVHRSHMMAKLQAESIVDVIHLAGLARLGDPEHAGRSVGRGGAQQRASLTEERE